MSIQLIVWSSRQLRWSFSDLILLVYVLQKALVVAAKYISRVEVFAFGWLIVGQQIVVV
jgi:hypothetical protein